MGIMSKLPLPEQDQDVSFSFWVEGETNAKYEVAAFAVEEAVLSLTQAEVLLVSSFSEFNSEALLGKKAVLQVQLHRYALPRRFIGIIAEAQICGGAASGACLHVLLLPALCRLENASRFRIFQELAVPDIIRAILAKYEIHDVSWQLAGRYSPRPSCVQYYESDLAFMHRILAEEGMYYYFTQDKDMAGPLVICDREAGFPGCPSEMRLVYSEGDGAYGNARCFSLVRRYRMADSGRNPGATVPDLWGKASSPYLMAGQTIRVEQHLDPALNESWRLLRVRHEGVRRAFLARQGDGLAFAYNVAPAVAAFPLKEPGLLGGTVHKATGFSSGNGDNAQGKDVEYACAFSAVRAGQAFRPRQAVKPLVNGPQKARVVAVDTTRVFLPRCKVLFAADGGNLLQDDTTCWVNMATPVDPSLAGAALPVIGEDVFVDFLGGDPDRPVIIARMGMGEASAPAIVARRPDGVDDVSPEVAVFEHAVQQEMLDVMHGYNVVTAVLPQVMADRGIVPLPAEPGVDKPEDKVLSAGEEMQEWGNASRVIKIGQHQREDIKGVYELNCGEKYLCKTEKLNINAAQKVTIRGPGGRIMIDNTSITLEAPVIRLKGKLLAEEGETARFEGIKSAIRDELPLVSQCAATAPVKSNKT